MTKYRMREVAEDCQGEAWKHFTENASFVGEDFVTDYTGELNTSKVKSNHSN